MAIVDFENLPSENTPLTGGASGNLNVMQENGTTHGSDTKLGYSQAFLNDHLVNVSNEVDEDYRVNLLKGKNLYNVATEIEDKVINSSGVIIDNTGFNLSDYINVKPNTKYTLSWESTSNYFQAYIVYYDNNNNFISREDLTTSNTYSKTFTTISNVKSIRITYSKVVSGSSAPRTNIQLVEGETSLPYSPFIQNQILVDNEKYTDTINVGSVVDSRSRVNVLHSKNLLPNNSSTITTNGITFTKNSDGSITINGTSTARADLYIFGGATDNGNYLKIKKGTYSFDRNNLTDGKMFFAFREKTAGTKYETLTNNDAIETMATQDCYFYGVMIGVESGNTINNLTIYPMLNEGNTLLPYEPYITPSIYVDNEEIYSKPVVLWTNSSPTSAFQSQNITLSSGDYDYLEIYYYRTTTQKIEKSLKVQKGENFLLTDFATSNNAYPWFRDRTFTYSNATQYAVGVCYLQFTNATTRSEEATGLIPLKIIGYK